MRIVRIIARLNVGGPAKHVAWLNEALDDDEFQSSLIAGRVPDGEKDMAYFSRSLGIQPIYIEQMSRELSIKDLVSLWKIYRALLRLNPDIIHTHTAKAGAVGRTAGILYRWLTIGALIGRPRKVKVVHTFHGHVLHSYYGALKTKIFLIIEKMLARIATDRIVVISQKQLEEISEKFRVGKREQYEIIRLGIDLEPLSSGSGRRHVIREMIGADDDEAVVGIVGRLTEVKNITMFLKVIRRYHDAEVDDVPRLRFVVIGDGNLRAELDSQAEELGIEELVSFVGNRDDPETFYAGLDIVALTSLNEGTPLSLIEAMACKKPVISTRVGGVSDLLGTVRTSADGFDICTRGLTVNSNDDEAFCKGLLRLAADVGLRAELSENGAEFVANNYSKQRLINDIKKLYRRLTK